jgi:hypothetical protein
MTVETQFYGDSSSFGYYWPSFFSHDNNSTDSYEHLLSEVVIKVTSDYQKWLMSITGCILVGLSGIFPLLLFSTGGDGSQPENKSDQSHVDPESGGECH